MALAGQQRDSSVLITNMNTSEYHQNDNHSRTIAHIHVDYFYIQLEVHQDQSLQNKPIAIQQNDIITTTNYNARECGIKRMMSVQDALQLCPQLMLLNRNADTFHNYRQISYSITAHLQKFSSSVERLGLDENFVDLSDIIQQRLGEKCTIIGEVFHKSSAVCLCGCFDRLKLATNIVEEIRESLKSEFKLMTRAGIAHNKLLARLACELHKPDKQTVIFPPNGMDLVRQLPLSEIPSLSKPLLSTLENDLNMKTLADLQVGLRCDSIPAEKLNHLLDLSMGIDNSPVKGRFVSLEDAHRPVSIESEVKDALEQLLKRLIVLITKDGRIPRRIELLVRKFDSHTKISHKDVKYFNLNPKLFMSDNKLHISDVSERKLLAITIKLFLKAVDIKRPYHITLLGLSFRRFRESMRVSRLTARLVNALLNEKIEVQSVTNIENKCDFSTTYMDTSYSCNGGSDNTDGSESEVESSPKKKKFRFISKTRCFKSECPSPSKLNVEQLRINSEF